MQCKALIYILPVTKKIVSLIFLKHDLRAAEPQKHRRKISSNPTSISLSVVRCNTKTDQSQHHPGQAPVLMLIVTTMSTSLLLLMTKAGARAAK